MVDQFASELSEWKEMSEDQHRNTNMNDKDHLVGQLTRYGGSLGQPNADNCPRDVWVEPAEVAKMICM